MTAAVEALLMVQAEDARLRAIESRREALMPPVRHAESVLERITLERDRTARTLEKETSRAEQGERRLAERKQHLEHWTERLGEAVRIADAAVAAEQVEAGRRAVSELESEVAASTRRTMELRGALAAHEAAVTDAVAALSAARAQTGAVLDALDAETRAVQADRDAKASRVDRPLLSLYDRVSHRRRATVLFPLKLDFTCGACDTAIPLQRRSVFTNGGTVEPCEGCGVLLYHHDGTTA